jgi:hypothetical protein
LYSPLKLLDPWGITTEDVHPTTEGRPPGGAAAGCPRILLDGDLGRRALRKQDAGWQPRMSLSRASCHTVTRWKERRWSQRWHRPASATEVRNRRGLAGTDSCCSLSGARRRHELDYQRRSTRTAAALSRPLRRKL